MFARPWILRPATLTLTLLAACFPLSSAAGLRDGLTATEARQLQREARLVFELLQNHHYSGRAFLELKNQDLLRGFLNELDPDGSFLLESDGEFIFRRFGQTLKSVYLARGDLQPAFEIFDLYQERVAARVDWIATRVTQPLDLTLDGERDEQAAKHPPKTAAEADARWELRLKDEILDEIVAGRTPDEAKTELTRRYREFQRNVAGIDPLLVRERFFDSVIRTYDPHSGYFSADSAGEFAVTMGRTLAGIGLRLGKREGRCVVERVDAGGPADLHSPLEPGDTVLALADPDGAWQDVASLRLQDIVRRVRGSAGTTLRLAYAPGGGNERREITLTRAEIVSPRDRASGAVLEVPADGTVSRRVGWIRLPAFYAAGRDTDATSATRDVRELLAAMDLAKLDGLVLDLRENPGGALTEAVGLSGLFLPPSSVVMHTRQAGAQPETLRTAADAAPLYTGPLVVLTSAQSASASEVFAGALKFHHRALIAGAASTYGKGTVQNYIELAAAARLPKAETASWGTLRLTAQRFYLPDGATVQRTGVTADLEFPGPGGESPPREADLPGALANEPTPIAPPVTPAVAAGKGQLDAALFTALRARWERDEKELPEWSLWKRESALRDRQRTEKHPLQQAAREASHQEETTAREELRRERRKLTAVAAWPGTACNLQAVTSALEQSDRALRAVDAQAAPGVVIVETEQHRLRKLRAGTVDFTRFSGDAAALAQAFSRSAGKTADPEAVRALLCDFSLQRERHAAAWQACARRHFPADQWTDDELAHGLAALLGALPAIDPELAREHAALDVPLREALRLAAEWAGHPQS
ncbi:MAG: PDZ domain-containing protein [Candidatus Didemnitutus sp.]|nr:PDZ domain-containing protein [Candidatus Didemnitutus sp.]